MNDYYIIKNATQDNWLNAIYQNNLSYAGTYYNAIQLSTQAIGEAFLAFCENADPETVFKLYRVEVSLNEVTQVP